MPQAKAVDVRSRQVKFQDGHFYQMWGKSMQACDPLGPGYFQVVNNRLVKVADDAATHYLPDNAPVPKPSPTG